MLDHFKAAIPEPYCILGLRLKPLSLGRYRLLRRFGCRFVSDETTSVGPQDLIIGVLICSMRCDEFLKFIESKEFVPQMRKWGRTVSSSPIIGKIPCIGKWWRKNHGFNIVEKFNLFQKYVKDAQEVPVYTVEDDGGGQASSAHWSHNLEILLRSELGWTAEEIDEQPLAKAISDHLKHLENHGRIRFMSDEEIEMGRLNAAALNARN